MSLSEFFDIQTSDYTSEKDKFIEHMDFLRSMSNEEYTLYKKWIEVQENSHLIDKSKEIKAQIWRPTDIINKSLTLEELESLQPIIEYIPSSDASRISNWLTLRIFTHTMEFEQNPGRFLRFLVSDKTTGKFLGIGSVGSDVISITCRDSWIGWDEKTKLSGKIRHSAIATTIAPTQPFGFNFLGGKLIASMMCLSPVSDAWKSTYDDVLVGITTTSLYGKHSMYQRIPFWKELGETTGRIMLKPSDKFYDFWHHWIQENKPELYKNKTTGGGKGPATGVKQKILVMIMQELGMKQSTYIHGFNRGVYYAPLYKNTKEYLCGTVSEEELIPIEKLQSQINSVMDWWKPKAINRYLKLFNDGRLNSDILFYNRLFGLSWDDTRKLYLGEVGR